MTGCAFLCYVILKHFRDLAIMKYENLSDRDLWFSEGKEKEMIEMLGYKLGKTKQELLNIIVTI